MEDDEGLNTIRLLFNAVDICNPLGRTPSVIEVIMTGLTFLVMAF